MTKVISFCLFGDNLKYTVGALRNAELAPKIYPGWETWFYMAASEAVGGRTTHYYSEVAQRLLDVGPHVQIKVVDRAPDWRLMLSRFLAITEPDVEMAIFRDTDSRLSLREKLAVDQWIYYDRPMHRMFDHPYHLGVPVLGGMWGLKKKWPWVGQMTQLVEEWSNKCEARWQCDQSFIKDKIWPLSHNYCLTHGAADLFHGTMDFPSPRDGLEFVGRVFDENELTVPEHDEALRKALDKWR